MPKKKAKRKLDKKHKKASAVPTAMRITAGRRALINELAGLLAEIAPATSRGKSSFCVQNIANAKKHQKLWNDKPNKKKSIAHYLEGVFRKYPSTPKKVVLEIVAGGVVWKAKKGVAVNREHLDAIADVLSKLSISATKELARITLPDPSKVAPPPLDLQSTADRLELHSALKDDCLTMFKAGHLNEAVRKALERFEKRIQDLTGDHEIGKSLMAKAFNLRSGLIRINDGTQPNDDSEQEGFMHLTMGAMAGMRNLYSHGDVSTIAPMDAFERLAFVSLLFKRVDQAIDDAAATLAGEDE
jgi:uncharacterized protein (TIGR02391 family)